jgi:hypothetical protein
MHTARSSVAGILNSMGVATKGDDEGVVMHWLAAVVAGRLIGGRG